ncbi:unnamed protein product [Echinostoma caproni]|uniref:Transmembrane protein n=1 Tax=Echinostoma caproni TaxID=27848 RepID=A0A183B0Z5_9TREM|nr:unnamed protein product [Echinostoma caproni]
MAENTTRKRTTTASEPSGTDNRDRNTHLDQTQSIKRLEQWIAGLETEVSELKRAKELTTGRNRSVLIMNHEEPAIRDAKIRADIDGRRVPGYYPRLLHIAFVPDSFGLGLTKAWGLHPQWTIWLQQWLLGTAVFTALTTRVRVPDQVEDYTPCLTYMVFQG